MTVPNGPYAWQRIGTSSLAVVPDHGSLVGLVRHLDARLDAQQAALYRFDSYYEGTQPLQFMAPEVAAQVGNRLAPLVINWPRTIVDSVQRRCYVEGFRMSDGQADAGLLGIWQANNLDKWSSLGQVDALVHGRAFMSVWTGADGAPRIRFESAHQMVVEYEPGDHVVSAALKRYVDGDVVRATLFEPNRVTSWVKGQAGTRGADWTLVETLPNPLGAVPVVPLVNRPRLLNLDGSSELTDVMPVADAVNKLATDMLIASEFSATRRRWATGIQIPNGPDRDRLQAEVAQHWDNASKGKTWLAGEGVNFGQFDEASLTNFVDAITLLTGQIAAIAGLPPHYLGIKGDNPASADAIRSAESTLVERAREKHQAWGDSYEEAMRLAVAVREGVSLAEATADLAGMETIWRDPETPTVAQAADAAVKLTQGERPIIDIDQAREDLGYSPLQIERMNDRSEQMVAASATSDVRARLALARDLQATDGLSQNAALAAVGLLQAAGLNQPTPPQ